VFENRVFRIIFGPKRDEATGEWMKLHNEELNDLYSSPNIVRVIKSGKIGLAGHVARMGEGVYRILVGKHEGKRPLGRRSVEGRKILKWMLKKWDGEAWTGLIWLQIGTGGGCT